MEEPNEKYSAASLFVKMQRVHLETMERITTENYENIETEQNKTKETKG